jgi:hypothetical protein
MQKCISRVMDFTEIGQLGLLTWIVVLVFRIISPQVNDSDEMGCLIPILSAIAVMVLASVFS